ncbi:MAG TPA: hypothetical protein VIZ65_15420 [Cellvibrionaceae bacterium]
MNESENDWRMQDFTHLTENWTNPWTGMNVPTGTQVTKISVVPLP